MLYMKYNIFEELGIEVPRNKKPEEHVTKEIENYLLDLIAEDSYQPFHVKELLQLVKDKFYRKYPQDLDAHVAWALDALHFNNLIKRVAPGTYESIDGPDDVYSERETGHSSEGAPYKGRGYNVKGIPRIGNRSEFNRALGMTRFGVKTLKNMGKKDDEIEKLMVTQGTHNPVVVKLALKDFNIGNFGRNF